MIKEMSKKTLQRSRVRNRLMLTKSHLYNPFLLDTLRERLRTYLPVNIWI